MFLEVVSLLDVLEIYAFLDIFVSKQVIKLCIVCRFLTNETVQSPT